MQAKPPARPAEANRSSQAAPPEQAPAERTPENSAATPAEKAAAPATEASSQSRKQQNQPVAEEDTEASPADPSAVLLAMIGERPQHARAEDADSLNQAETAATLRLSGHSASDKVPAEASDLTDLADQSSADADTHDASESFGNAVLAVKGGHGAPGEMQGNPFSTVLGAQQSIAGALAATTGAAADIPARLGTAQWDQAIGQRMIWMAAGAQHSASLTLSPPELGPLQITLSLNNAQASATFISAQPDVRQALEAAMPRLREMLGDAGIQLGQTSVNAGNPQQQPGFAQQDSGSGRQRHDGGADNASSEPALAPTLPDVPLRSGRGLVDTFA